MRKVKILLFVDNFPPEVNAPATRSFEHAKKWVEMGADVTVITSCPNFPLGKPFPGYKNRFKSSENVQGIRVIRVWTFIHPNSGFLLRSLDQLSYSVMAPLLTLFLKGDIVLVSSPQFFIAISTFFYAKIKRIEWVLEIRDIWPESLIAVGVLKENRLYKALERIEVWLYHNASKIVVVTDSFKANLINRGIDGEKIGVFKNGVLESKYDANKVSVVLSQALPKIRNKIVVGYVGTMGLAHSLDFIITTIVQEKLQDFHFIFIGEGSEKEKLKNIARGTENITILDAVRKDEVPSYLALVDIVLVNLAKRPTFKEVIPSKIFEACSMSKPILLGVEGEAKLLIDKYDAGLSFRPEDKEDFVNCLLKLKNKDLRLRLGYGGVELARQFDRDTIANNLFKFMIK